MEIILREYQVEAKKKIMALYEENPRGKAKFVWATGLGKTVGFSAIAHEIRERTGTNVLIIAHRDELLTQAAQKYHFIDPDARIGKVGKGLYEWGLPITVASIQTLAKPNHLKNLKQFNFGLVIFDEVHHAHKDNEYGKVYEALPNAFKIGCTATDGRLDKITNTDMFGESVHTMTILDGIEQGYLAPIKAKAIRTGTSLDDLHTKDGDYQIKELSSKIDTSQRNREIVEGYRANGENRQFMAFCIDIAHAEHLAEAFNQTGIPTIAVNGTTQNRSQVTRDFERGVYRGICNCQVFTEGYDAETTYDEDMGQYIFLSCAIMARPTKSSSLFIQCIGRILRLAPTKTDALLLDATDNVFNHRLQPQTLGKVLDIPGLRDGETVLEAKERTDREANEQSEKRERKTTVVRDKDLHIDLLEKLLWQARADGKFVLEVGKEKHRIALIPCKEAGLDLWGNDGYYRVAARLAPYFDLQWWSEPLQLDWAQQQAERRARMLLADPKSVKLIDRNAGWRGDPPSPEQLEKIQKYIAKGWIKQSIPVDEEGNVKLTKGEASDLLQPVFDMFEVWRKRKEARNGVAV